MTQRSGKTSVVKKTMKDPELIDMFNQMMGVSTPDLNIVIPKYEIIYKNSRNVIMILKKFSISPLAVKFASQFPLGFEQLNKFVDESEKILVELGLEKNDNIMSSEEMQRINLSPEKIIEAMTSMNMKYKVSNIKEQYAALRDSKVVREMVMMARNLKNALMLEKKRANSKTHNLEVQEKLSEEFILNSDDDYFTLFNFTSLDFKQMFCSENMNEEYRKYMLLVLYLIYGRVIEVVQNLTSPDIDVDKFSEVIIKSIDQFRKHIPRCDKAFNKIKSSVGMLKNNFGEYYKDFVTSQNCNPGIIIENFVTDVAKDSSADLETTRQFRQIVSYYKQQVSGKKVNDPGVQKMLSLVGENLDILEDRLGAKKDKSSGESEKGEKSGEKNEEKNEENEKKNEEKNEESKKGGKNREKNEKRRRDKGKERN
jgi:hypothetical protein